MNTKQTDALKLALEALGWYDRETHQKAITAIREALVEQSARRQNSIEPIEFLSGFLTERLAIERGIEWTPAIHDLCNRAIEEEKLAEQPAQQPLTDTELINQGCRYQTELTQPAQQQEPEVGVGAENGAKPSETRMDTGFSGGGNPPAQQQVPRAARGDWGAKRKQPAQQEPVAAECKFDHEEKWARCNIAHHNLVQSEPEKWPGYQTRLLYTSPQPAIPKGWRLVPVEPTMNMIFAMRRTDTYGDAWTEALNAAPQPQGEQK